MVYSKYKEQTQLVESSEGTMPFAMMPESAAKLGPMLALNPNDKIAWIGCGNCQELFTQAILHPAVLFIGSDVNDKAVKYANKIHQTQLPGIRNVQLLSKTEKYGNPSATTKFERTEGGDYEFKTSRHIDVVFTTAGKGVKNYEALEMMAKKLIITIDEFASEICPAIYHQKIKYQGFQKTLVAVGTSALPPGRLIKPYGIIDTAKEWFLRQMTGHQSPGFAVIPLLTEQNANALLCLIQRMKDKKFLPIFGPKKRPTKATGRHYRKCGL